MSEELSKKITILSFGAMIMILFIHSFNLTIFAHDELDNNSVTFFIQDFISFHICRIAVPLFFIVSSFLLTVKYQNNWASYVETIKKRVKSLLVPYLFWCFLWTFLFYLVGKIPLFNGFINNPIEKPILSNFFRSIFINPICYQFWFIRDLFVLVILYPFFNIMIRKLSWIFIIILYLLFIFFPEEIFFFKSSSMLFFCIGILIFYRKEFFKKYIDFFPVKVVGIFWVLGYFVFKFYDALNSFENYCYPFFVLIGINYLTRIYDVLMSKELSFFKILENHSKYSFFIFAFHEPVMILIKKVLLINFSKVIGANLLIYFLTPTIVYCISILVAFYLRKYFFKLYNISVGGR